MGMLLCKNASCGKKQGKVLADSQYVVLHSSSEQANLSLYRHLQKVQLSGLCLMFFAVLDNFVAREPLCDLETPTWTQKTYLVFLMKVDGSIVNVTAIVSSPRTYYI